MHSLAFLITGEFAQVLRFEPGMVVNITLDGILGGEEGERTRVASGK